jgi:hypothetical protein
VTVLAEQAAPAWLPFVFLAIPVLIMAAVLIPALKRRSRAGVARRSQASRRQATTTALGSAASIADPSGHSAEAILKALAFAPEDHGPRDGLPHDEGWSATMLGLKSKVSSSTSVLEPNIYWGVRDRGQVFVRIGPDEKIEGGTTMLSNRHVRLITVLRVDAPPFDAVSDGGDLRASEDSPPEVRELIDSLAADRATWSDVRVTGGPKGIVAARPAIDDVGYGWAYDLWLCEWLASRLDLRPLEPARVGPAWKVPYGLGRSLTPER